MLNFLGVKLIEMFKTKLFEVLKTMEIEELNRFQSFTQSPYHNTNKTISRFMDYVYKYFDTLGGKSEGKRFEKKAIFKKVYANTEFNEGTFSVLRSQTLSLLEDFFIIERFNSEKKIKQKFLAESYEARNIPRAFHKNYLKYEEINEEERWDDEDWTMHRLKILLTKMNWVHYDKIGEGYSMMLEVLEDLDVYYLHKKMMLESIKANFDKSLGRTVHSQFYDATFREQLTKYKEKSSVIDLYVRWRELMYGEKKDMVLVEEFRNDFEIAISNLAYEDKEIIYYDLQNLVISEYNKKGKNLASIAFDTYMTGINSTLINIEHQIYYKTFYNIITTGSVAGNFAEVKDFISKYGNRVNLKDRSAILLLCQARILYDERGENCWKKIVDLINNFNHTDPQLKGDSRSLELRAFFMMYKEDSSYYYLVLNRIKSFKTFLYRETGLRKGERIRHQHLAFWLQKLVEAYNSNKQDNDMIKMFSKIEDDTKLTIFCRDWLLGLRNEERSE